MNYEPGQRVALTPITGSSLTARHGVVRVYDSGTQVVTVGWDDGTITEVRPADGDRLDVLATPQPISEAAWQQVLAAVSARGSQDGRRAFEQWGREQDGRDPAQVRTTARQILQNLHSGEDLDDLPGLQYLTSGFAQPPSDDQLSQLLADGEPARWQPVGTDRWEQAVWRYRDAFETAVQQDAGDWARRTLIPAAGGRDLAGLRADQVCSGRVGVFSGDWMWTQPHDGPDYCRIGFVGTLIDRWNGWAVFSCTRQVAGAIVTDQQQQRAQEQARLQAGGMSQADARRQVDGWLADLTFNGDTIVADQRVMSDDPDAIERITPDPDGRYVVMGWNWCWQAVDPYDCDRIVGDIPAPGGEREFVLLEHTAGMRLPHDRLRLQVLRHWPVTGGLAYVGALLYDGLRVATVGNDAAGNGTDLLVLDQAAAEQLAAFLTGCRYQGQPVGWPRLLDALADEVYVAAAVKHADADGQALVRSVDTTGRTRSMRPVYPKPSGWDALTRLGADLAHESTNQWQLWTGRSWLILPAHARHIS